MECSINDYCGLFKDMTSFDRDCKIGDVVPYVPNSYFLLLPCDLCDCPICITLDKRERLFSSISLIRNPSCLGIVLSELIYTTQMVDSICATLGRVRGVAR